MKRRKFTLKFKTRVVLDALKESQGLSELSQKYELAPTQISKWKKEFLLGAENAFGTRSSPGKSASQTERERLLITIGELKMENDFLKKNLP